MSAPQGPASRNDSLAVLVAAGGAGKRVFVKTQAFTTSAGNLALPTITDSTLDTGRAIPANACWVFQPDADCQIALCGSSQSLTNTNSGWIAAGQFDQQYAEPSDAYILFKGRTASGNLQIFVLL